MSYEFMDNYHTIIISSYYLLTCIELHQRKSPLIIMCGTLKSALGDRKLKNGPYIKQIWLQQVTTLSVIPGV